MSKLFILNLSKIWFFNFSKDVQAFIELKALVECIGKKFYMNILVVDDQQNVREHLRNLLTSQGYTVITAVNGLDGFEKAQKDVFHLYIIDHLMPLMNGATLAKNIKKLPSCIHTPILFMTTQGKACVENLAEYSLLNDVIAKPLNEVEFILSVKNLLAHVETPNYEAAKHLTL